MAKGETIGSLSISLGIDLSQLQPDLLTAEDTVAKAMGKLTQKAAQTKLRTEIEIANLDGVGKEIDIAKAKEQELIQLLDIENQKLKIRQANYQANVKNYGEDAGVTRSSLTSMLNQEKQVASLNAQLRNLRETLKQPVPQSGVVSGLNRLGDAIRNTQGGLAGFNARLTNALSGSTGMAQEIGGVLSSLPGKAGLAGAAIAAVGAATVGAVHGLVEFARNATASGDALYKASIKFGMSTKELKELQNFSKFGAGTEVETVIQSLSRLDKSLLSAGKNGNAATRMLDSFGVSLRNGSGNLLTYNEQVKQIAEGYEKAKEAGQGAEYLLSVFGTRGANEMRAYLDMIKEAREDMAQVDTFIKPIDPKEAHKMQRQIRVMDEEWNRLKASAANALLPIAQELMPQVLDATKTVLGSVKELGEAFKHVNLNAQEQAQANKVVQNAISGANSWQIGAQPMNSGLQLQIDKAKEQAEAEHQLAAAQIEATRRREQASQDAAKAKEAEAEQVNAANEKMLLSEEDLVSLNERISAYRQETEDKAFKANHSALENQIYDIEKWRDKELEAIENVGNADEQRAAISEAASERIVQAREEEQKALERLNSSIEDKIFELTHSETENKLHRLQQEIDKYIKDGADASLVETYRQLQSQKIIADAQKSARSSFSGSGRSGGDRLGSHIIDIRDGQIMERYGSLFNGYMESGAKNARDAVGSVEKISDFRPHIFDVQDGQVLESAGDSFKGAMSQAAQYAQDIVDAAQAQERMLDQYQGTDVSEYTDWSGKNYKIDKDSNGNSMYDGAIMTAMQAKALIDMREVFDREAESYFQRGNRGGQNFAGQREGQANPVNLTVNNNFSGNVLENEQFMQKISDDAAGRVADEVRKATASATSATSYA